MLSEEDKNNLTKLINDPMFKEKHWSANYNSLTDEIIFGDGSGEYRKFPTVQALAGYLSERGLQVSAKKTLCSSNWKKFMPKGMDKLEKREWLEEQYSMPHWEFLDYTFPGDPEWKSDMKDADWTPESEILDGLMFESWKDVEDLLLECAKENLPGAKEKLRRVRQVMSVNSSKQSSKGEDKKPFNSSHSSIKTMEELIQFMKFNGMEDPAEELENTLESEGSDSSISVEDFFLDEARPDYSTGYFATSSDDVLDLDNEADPEGEAYCRANDLISEIMSAPDAVDSDLKRGIAEIDSFLKGINSSRLYQFEVQEDDSYSVSGMDATTSMTTHDVQEEMRKALRAGGLVKFAGPDGKMLSITEVTEVPNEFAEATIEYPEKEGDNEEPSNQAEFEF